MSLSQAILFDTYDHVKSLIDSGANVSEQDSYGYTPLIEATLKQDVSIATLLLKHGAKVDQEDIGGQTALHWATKRYHMPLCQLFLSWGADPNHYSADGQPILVNPLLRNQQDLIKLLKDHGANEDFAWDFIHAKLMGHRFELTGKSRIINTKHIFVDVSLEGFYLEFTLSIILKNLIHFMNNEHAERFSAYSAVVHKASKALKQISKIIPYRYLKQSSVERDQEIRSVLNEDLVVIPVTYEGHAITFVKYGRLWAKCDRGVKHIVDTVVISYIGNPNIPNADFLRDLMFHSKDHVFIEQELSKLLDLKPIISLPARYQLSGNCSWANVEASVPAMMFMLMYRGENQSRGEIAALQKSVMQFYDVWVEMDKDRALHECINIFNASDSDRRVSKASLLGAILFQRCRANRPKEVDRAKLILSVLTKPECRFILQTYLKVYYTKMSGEVGLQFIELLRACGYKLSALGLTR